VRWLAPRSTIPAGIVPGWCMSKRLVNLSASPLSSPHFSGLVRLGGCRGSVRRVVRGGCRVVGGGGWDILGQKWGALSTPALQRTLQHAHAKNSVDTQPL
jgi:hypothetical protein